MARTSTSLTRIRRGASVLGMIALVAICGHYYLNGESLLESIYWFTITVSSVGYTEDSRLTPGLQVFTIFVIVVGMSTVAYTVGGLLQMMTEGEIEQALGARRMTNQIDHLAQHVIICGFGRIGRTLADEMAHKGEPFVVLDADPEQAADGRKMGFLMLLGNATDEDVLLAAGVRRAKTLVSALNRDSDNVFITLTSRNLNADLRIIARGEQPATEKKLVQAGADHVVLPAVIGARRMATMVTRPHAADLIDQVTDRKILGADLEEVAVSSSSPGVGKTVQEIMARRKHRLLVVAVRQPDGEMVFAPDADYRLDAGTTMIVMGRPADTASFRQLYES